MEEESFPRGGYEPKSDSAAEIKEKEQGVELFKDNKKKERKQKEGKNKEKQTVKSKKKKILNVEDEERNLTPEPLTKKNMYQGMLVLGCVSSVQNYSVRVALPNCLRGQVPITKISQAYTQGLEEYARAQQSGEGHTWQNIATLNELFREGMIVPCKITECDKAGKKIKLSMDPAEVNSEVTVASLKNGMTIYGSVSSVEDHGYTVDLGLTSVQAFLPQRDAHTYIQECNNGAPLAVGQLLLCKLVIKPDQEVVRVVSVTIDPSQHDLTKIKMKDELAFSTVIPGLKVKAKIEKVLSSGLRVSFNNLKGYIHTSHLPSGPKEYTEGDKVVCRVLYVHPVTKAISLSLMDHLVNYRGQTIDLCHGFERGEIVEGAKVTRFDKVSGAYLELPNGSMGCAPLHQLKDKKSQIGSQEFKKGSSHRCRVIGVSPMEGHVIVSLKKKVLEEKYLNASDIKPGEKLYVILEEFQSKGVSVKVRKGIKGFIPSIHLADITLTHPEKKFKVGEEMKCRVLYVNKKGCVMLTNKRSLVQSKLPIISSYDQLKHGQDAEGFISSVREFGVFVRFYNGVQGLVPRPLLSTEKIEYPEKVFYKGQVVRCKVISCSPAEEKLKLTFILEGKKSFGQKTIDVPDDYAPGKLISCRVVKKTSTGLDVVVLPSEKKAFIPKMHLSDYNELCSALWEMYQPGDVIEEVMYISQVNALTLTRKKSFIATAKRSELVTDFNKLEPGSLLPGSVKNFMPYGIFVEFPNGMIGLVPKRYVCDRRVPDVGAIYQLGQSVEAKVVEVEQEKKRFLSSLRMVDCYHSNTKIGMQLLENYIAERKEVFQGLGTRDSHQTLTRLKVGKVYKATVTKETEFGLVLQLKNGTEAIATHDQIDEMRPGVGSKVKCVCLYVDLLAPCVEVSLKEKLVKLCETRASKKDTLQQVKVNQVVKAEVQLIKEDFILVSLRNHGNGQFAYLPAKRHLNDVLERHQYGIGQVNNVMIKKIEDGVIYASLGIHEEKDQMLEKEETSDSTVNHVPWHQLQLGDMCTAVVKKVMADQLYVNIDKTYGRIHVTEMLDQVVNGNNPLVRFKPGMEVKARVIGFRQAHSKRFMPVSNRNVMKAMPECSIRPSILSLPKLPNNFECYKNNLKVGNKIVAYATKFSNSCLWMQVSPTVEGRVFLLNMLDDLQKLQRPQDMFLPGKGYNATVIGVVSDTLVELSLTDKKAEVRKGSVCLGVIKTVTDDSGITLQMAEGYRGAVDLTDVADTFSNKVTSEFRRDQVVECYVLQMDKQDKQATVSLRASRLKKEKQKVTDPEIEFSDIQQGMTLRGYVTRVTDIGISVRLGRDLTGHIAPDLVTNLGQFTPGNVVTVKVINVDKEARRVGLTTLENDTSVPTGKESKRKRKNSENTAVDSDKENGLNEKKKKRKTSESEDSSDKKKNKKEKTSVKTDSDKVVMSEDENIVKTKADIPSVSETVTAKKEKKRKKSETSVDDDIDERKDKVNEKKVKSKKLKLGGKTGDTSSEKMEDSDSGIEMRGTSKDKKQVQSKPVLEVSEGFSWDTEFKLPSAVSGEISSDDSDDEDAKPVKKSKEELRKEKIEEEKKLYEYEMQQLEGEREPETADDFDRLVLQSPDSSMIWLRYMAFHLGTSDIDKARAVAERALKTISFREEQEKLNVWVGYLNLENMYGTSDSLNKVLARAVQQNDQVSVYTQMVDIYTQSGKVEEAEHLFNIMLKKHSGRKDIWIRFGRFYFQQQRLESARKLLQRCLKSLESKFHVDTIAKFAQMEFKFGEPERGKTMFDNLLSTYPNRTDLWSVYIDMVTKLADHNNTRSLYNRVIGMKMAAKKMKFFFKKYLQFEEQHGTPAQVSEVKKKALEYVESQGYIED